ncbi:MAG: hypothetical protein ACR2PR_02850 [Pseudohongiellaceae bacterium]
MYIRNALILIATLLLTTCGSSQVVIEGNFPTPNIQKLPLRVAVYYDTALRDFSYTEYNEIGDEEYNVDSGLSHIRLFNAVLPAMFTDVVVVDSVEEAATLNVDAVFRPAIEEFQLALPDKTMLDAYEVWIKYNMRLLTADGGYIADWVVTSYGKTQKEGFQSAESSINEATIIALRDLASNFSLRFSEVPEVRDWMSQ